MLETRPLTYFISAYELRSITAAANKHYIAQPSVSHAIKGLEEQLECILFIRSRTGLTPTEEGHKLYRQSVKVLDSMNSIQESFKPKPTVELKIFSQPDILLGQFSENFKRLYKSNPALLLKFTECPKEAELALLHSHLCPTSHEFHPLRTEEYVVAMHSTHPLSIEDNLKIEDIVSYPIIARSYCPYKERLIDELLKRKLDLNEVAQATNDQHLLELVTLGIGIAFIPETQAIGNDKIVTKRLHTTSSFQRTIGISVNSSDLAIQMYKAWC